MSIDYSKEAALSKLRHRLLDISNKNAFLNHKDPYTSKGCIPFINFYAEQVILELLKGTSLEIACAPDPVKDPSGKDSHTKDSWFLDNVGAIDKESNSTYSTKKDLTAYECNTDFLAKSLKLVKKAKLSIEETGANSLFLVYGLLFYKSTKDPSQPLYAPLINLPIELNKKDGGLSWEVSYTGAPLVENFSIKERLKNEYNLSLPDLFDPDESDAESYLGFIQKSLKDPEWKVSRQLFITNMSPLNMVLFNDLREENWDKHGKNLITSPAIAELLSQETHVKTDDLYHYDIDSIDVSNPDYPWLIEEADSSQLNAILNVINTQENQVIIGPPGTGKSQTITNLIANLLKANKKVLFISEKQAALEVVKQRLVKAGLGPFVLSLHNNKISKKEVISDIVESIDAPIDPSIEKSLQNRQTLEENRQALARYCYTLNEDMPNLNQSAYDLIWEQQYLENTCKYKFSKPVFDKLNAQEFLAKKPLLNSYFAKLQTAFEQIGPISDKNCFSILVGNSFTEFYLAEFSSKLQGIFRAARNLKSALNAVALFDLKDLRIAPKIAQDQLSMLIEGLPTTIDLLGYNAYSNDETAYCAAVASYYDSVNSIGLLEKNLDQSGLSANALSQISYTPTQFANAARLQIKPGPIPKDSLTFLLLQNPSDFADTYSELKSVNWDFFDTALKELPTVISQLQSLDAQYFNYQYLVKKNKALCAEAISLKKEIVLQETALPITLPKEEHTLLEVMDDIKTVIKLSDSSLRKLYPSWHSALQRHKLLQKDKARSFSASEKESNLIELYSVYEKYVKLNALLEDLPSDISMAEQGVLFDFVEIEDSLHTVEKSYSFIKNLFLNFDYKSITPEHLSHWINLLLKLQAQLSQANPLISAINNCGYCFKDFFDKDAANSILGCFEQIQKTIILAANEDNYPSLATIQNALTIYQKLVEKRNLLQADTFSKYGFVTNNAELYQSTVAYMKKLKASSCYVAITPALEKATNATDLKNALIANIAKIKDVQEGFELLTNLITEANNTFEFKIDSANLEKKQILDAFIEKALLCLDKIHLLKYWLEGSSARHSLINAFNIADVLTQAEEQQVPYQEVYKALIRDAYLQQITEFVVQDPILINSVGGKQEEIRQAFSSQDTLSITENRLMLKNHLLSSRRLPKGESGARVKDYTDMVLLRHLKKTPGARVSLREIFIKAGSAVQELTPCFLMGPQAVAQYLTPSEFEFDTLIIDEASQMRLEHSLGAVARSKQIIVVGDPEQLGPSAAFQAVSMTDMDEEPWAILESESILKWASNKYKESILNWHYRSKHESLIDFSNKTFYKNKLVIAPSSEHRNELLGLNYHFLDKAVYNERTNEDEIRAIAQRAIKHMEETPFYSLGIVALNLFQAEEIEKEIEKHMTVNPNIAKFIERWELAKEPFFVKNLENVQGDERDAIYVSLTFGTPLMGGPVKQNFGLISRDDGGRRLNVLITRAKRVMHVYSSLKSMDIKEEPKTPRGTILFKRFLEHCENIKSMTAIMHEGTPESPFEKVICDVLDKNGYKYTCQLGVAGYRIDIAIKNPYADGFLAAIECDGASYHGSASVKDRDKVRQKVLEERGWKGAVYRIWSTDWFKNKEIAEKNLLEFLAAKEANFAS